MSADIHPDEADAARLDAVMRAHYDTYGEDGPTAADVLDDEEIAHLEAARPPADEARRNNLSMAAVLLAAAGVPDDENEGLAELEALDAVAGPPAPVGDGLWRGRAPRPRLLSLLAAADASGGVPLGWSGTWGPGVDSPVLWDQTASHLVFHTNDATRDDAVHLDEAAAAALAAAVGLVRCYGPGAVTLVDAYPGRTPDEARRWWAPLVDAGVDVHPVVADPARAVGAMAGVAAAALAYRDAASAPRYLVVLHADRLLWLLEGTRRPHYAAAARDTLRIIRDGGVARRVHLVLSHLGVPVGGRDPLAAVSYADSGEWAYRARYSPIAAEVFAGPPSPRVVLPEAMPPARWAAHLTG